MTSVSLFAKATVHPAPGAAQVLRKPGTADNRRQNNVDRFSARASACPLHDAVARRRLARYYGRAMAIVATPLKKPRLLVRQTRPTRCSALMPDRTPSIR